MSFSDSDAVARIADRLDRLEFLDADEHHQDCPQHPWNNVCDYADPCECHWLREADVADALDARRRS